MKKILLAGLVLSGFVGGSATAADLARPVYKAAPPPVEVFDWSGIYIGAHVGGGWGRTDITDHTFFGNLLFIPTQHIATTGALVGVRGGWNSEFGRLGLGRDGHFPL